MRAAAVTLVLIFGAIVVLLMANTLNSWVLGGLIGGLAALLISIPISVTLFLYLSRRHEDMLKAHVEEEYLIEQEHRRVARPVEVEAEAYMLPAEEDWDEDGYERYIPETRNIPVAAYPRLPEAGNTTASPRTRATGHIPAPQTSQISRSVKDTPAHGRGAPGRQSAQRQSTQRPAAFPGQPAKTTRHLHHTAALRAARLEAAEEKYGPGVVSETTSKRLPAVSSPKQVMKQEPRSGTLRPSSRHLPAQNRQSEHYQSRQTVEGYSVPPTSPSRRSLPSEGESTASRPSQQTNAYSRLNEPRTDKIHPNTEPFRQSPQTGQITRRPQLDETQRNSERMSGTLKNPLIRRAPYMYEDDPLRQELAQQIDGPITRRSSLRQQFDEDEE